MPVPRFHIRTLMIAVAGVALVLWVCVMFPEALYPAARYVGIASIIPMIGAIWRGGRASDRFDGAVAGGVLGALIQAGVLVAIALYSEFRWSNGDPEHWLIFFVYMAFIVLLSFVLGTIVGLLVGVGLGLCVSLRQWSSLNSRRPSCDAPASRHGG